VFDSAVYTFLGTQQSKETFTNGKFLHKQSICLWNRKWGGVGGSWLAFKPHVYYYFL